MCSYYSISRHSRASKSRQKQGKKKDRTPVEQTVDFIQDTLEDIPPTSYEKLLTKHLEHRYRNVGIDFIFHFYVVSNMACGLCSLGTTILETEWKPFSWRARYITLKMKLGSKDILWVFVFLKTNFFSKLRYSPT